MKLTKRQREVLRLVEEGWRLVYRKEWPNIVMLRPRRREDGPPDYVFRHTLQPLFDAGLLKDPRLGAKQ